MKACLKRHSSFLRFMSAFVVLVACSRPQPASTPLPTPRPSVVSLMSEGKVAPGSVYPSEIHISYGALRATASYPVVDYSNYSEIATRFQLTDNRQLLLAKLTDNMPLDLRIVTLEGYHTVVLLDTYSGGAHCCFETILADPGGRFGLSFATADWANTRYKLIKSTNDSGYVFETYDNAMAYAFSDFAGSVMPILIASYRDGKFVDVTNNYVAALRKDAAGLWKLFLTEARSQGELQPILVSYLADEYRLGRSTQAWERVHAAYGIDKNFDAKAISWLQKNGYAPSTHIESALSIAPQTP